MTMNEVVGIGIVIIAATVVGFIIWWIDEM